MALECDGGLLEMSWRGGAENVNLKQQGCVIFNKEGSLSFSCYHLSLNWHFKN